MKTPPYTDPDLPKQPKWWPGLVAVLVLGFIVLLLAFATGCEGMPLTLSVYSDHARASYSSKSGLEISVQK